MTTRFCQECGTPAEPAALFCAPCGARLATPPGGPGMGPGEGVSMGRGVSGRALAAPAAGRRHVRLLSLATVVAVVVLAGGTLIFDRLGRPTGGPTVVPGGATGVPTRVPGPSPAAAAISSVTPGPTPGPSTSPALPTAPRPPTAPPQPTAPPIATLDPGVSAPLVAAETPLGAVAAFIEDRGAAFAGVCSAANPVSDAGSYCADLVDDRAALQVHLIGLVGSEPDTWLLVADGQYGWAVIEWAPVGDPAASPPF